jgi:hypothetical protein
MLAQSILLALPVALGFGDVLDTIEPAAAWDVRGETRARPAGQAHPDDFAVGEFELTAGATAGIRISPVAVAIRYAPSITFTSYDPLTEPLLLHIGMGRFYIEAGPDVRIFGAHVLLDGERNFAAALIHEEETGRLRLEYLPEIERLPIEARFTTVGASWRAAPRREFRVTAGYSVFGGKGEWAQRRLPLQTGPRFGLYGDWGFSAKNAAIGSMRLSRTVFDPGPTFRIGEIEGGWRHHRDRHTEIRGLVGLFAGVNEEPVGDELRSAVLPMLRGDLTRQFGRGRQLGEFELVLSARPFINQLHARLDPRVAAEMGMDWSWREQVSSRLDLGHAWLMNQDLTVTGRVTAMGGSLALPLGDLMEIEGGMRLFRQRVRYGVGWWGPAHWRWDLFIALSARSDLLERR